MKGAQFRCDSFRRNPVRPPYNFIKVSMGGGEVETVAGAGPAVPSGFLRLSTGKSALDAVGQARQRCWSYDWIIDLDIRRFFARNRAQEQIFERHDCNAPIGGSLQNEGLPNR